MGRLHETSPAWDFSIHARLPSSSSRACCVVLPCCSISFRFHERDIQLVLSESSECLRRLGILCRRTKRKRSRMRKKGRSERKWRLGLTTVAVARMFSTGLVTHETKQAYHNNWKTRLSLSIMKPLLQSVCSEALANLSLLALSAFKNRSCVSTGKYGEWK